MFVLQTPGNRELSHGAAELVGHGLDRISALNLPRILGELGFLQPLKALLGEARALRA
jgi:hypothetical protein